MSFKLCSSGAIVIRAGANVNSDASASGAILEQFSNEAEGYVNATTRYDWVTNYTSIGAEFKPMLATATSCLAAADLIAYDMGGYTGRGEAESMINILYDRATRALTKLTDDKNKTKMGAEDT